MDNITSSELVGFAVGTFLLSATIAAPKIDALLSAFQRSSLGMCKRCGNLGRIACSRCKGTGLIAEGGIPGINLVEDLLETLGRESKASRVGCMKCASKGSFPCPDCENV